MTLTAHQRIELRRRFPEAQLEMELAGKIALVFEGGAGAYAERVTSGQWCVSIIIPPNAIAGPGCLFDARDALRAMLQ